MVHRLVMFVACPLLLLTPVFPAVADDYARLAKLLEPTGTISIPPGDYHLNGHKPLTIKSHQSISAYGARFILPEQLPDQARLVVFSGDNISHFTWLGGEFVGNVFDPAQKDNLWEPNANTKGIEITTSLPGATHDITFRDLKSQGLAGAAISIHGIYNKSDEQNVQSYAQRIHIENCTLLRSGKFMWDYGYLWQILSFPNAYEPWEVDRAARYFRMDLTRNVHLTAHSNRIQILATNTSTKPLSLSTSAEPKDAISFFGNNLPQPLVRGKQYFITNSSTDSIQITDELPGQRLDPSHAVPITISSDADCQIITNLHATYLAAYAPTGSGPGKGAFDIVAAENVRVSGCQLSALGDTMHIQRCRNITFTDNQIIGSRMGAFFLAEFCQNATISGNLVDGTNGSRVISVEKSCRDVTMSGNTFRHGGRGSWINQPVNFVMTDNIFVNNTTKNDPDPRVGRIAFQTGQPGRFPELYFTLYEPNATYGPVIVRNNIFQPGDHCPEDAVTFAPNGHDLVFTDNVFHRQVNIVVDPSCSNLRIENNLNAKTQTSPVDFNHGRR